MPLVWRAKSCRGLAKADLFSYLQALSFDFLTGPIREVMCRVWKDDVDHIRVGPRYLCIMLSVENIIYFVSATVILFTLNWKLHGRPGA